MTNRHATHAAFGKQPKRMAVSPDEAIHWGCSMKGWNCCVDKGITVRPYDMVRLRHAFGRPSHELTTENLVTFAWHDPTGALVGSLAHQPYTPGHVACVFYDEVTNRSAATMRDEDPARFASMPLAIQRAADASATNEYRVAGLCQGHMNRPEVCRGFPFQREVHVEPSGETSVPGMLRVNVCGSCALSTPTTPRQTAEENDVFEYWRANDAFVTVMAYYRSRGAARMRTEGYRALPLNDAELSQLWGEMYLCDREPEVVAGFSEQWRSDLDIEGDRAIYRIVLERALDRVDTLLEKHGLQVSDLGTPGAPDIERPNLDVLLDPARAVLAPREEHVAA